MLLGRRFALALGAVSEGRVRLLGLTSAANSARERLRVIEETGVLEVFEAREGSLR